MPQRRYRRRDVGFTLIEVVVALAVIVLTLIGLVAGISYASRTNATILESEMVMRGAQKKLEEIRSYPVGFVWACFNNKANDALLGLAPELGYPLKQTAYPDLGTNMFDVDGLEPIGDTVNGVTWTKCGMVSFPGDQVDNLLEITDTTDPMYDENATDLNANHVTAETLLVGSRYNLLPVTITIRWKGLAGKRTMTFRYLLIESPTGTAADFVYPGKS